MPPKNLNQVKKLQVHVRRMRGLDIAPLTAKRIRALIAAILEAEGVMCDEVTVHFVNKATISALHERFFQDPSPTDTISLPLDDPDDSGGYCVLGDVFVCPEVAFEYTAHQGGNPLQETLLYMIHGLLHLVGYDDTTPLERRLMRAAERKHLRLVAGSNTV